MHGRCRCLGSDLSVIAGPWQTLDAALFLQQVRTPAHDQAFRGFTGVFPDRQTAFDQFPRQRIDFLPPPRDVLHDRAAQFGQGFAFGHPMSAADASWFHNDGPANLAIVMGVVLTKKPLDFERVRKIYEKRIVSFDRFRQRVVEAGFPLATPHWQDMPNFSIDQHLHHIAQAMLDPDGTILKHVGTIHDVTATVYPDLVDAACRIAKAIKIPVVGIDFMVHDPAKPDYVFIEANERPGLANHEPQPTAECFIQLLFPGSRARERRLRCDGSPEMRDEPRTPVHRRVV